MTFRYLLLRSQQQLLRPSSSTSSALDNTVAPQWLLPRRKYAVVTDIEISVKLPSSPIQDYYRQRAATLRTIGARTWTERTPTPGSRVVSMALSSARRAGGKCIFHSRCEPVQTARCTESRRVFIKWVLMTFFIGANMRKRKTLQSLFIRLKRSPHLAKRS